jgi:ubiquinone/menaquinone biosynthesis C-methylase UbiE
MRTKPRSGSEAAGAAHDRPPGIAGPVMSGTPWWRTYFDDRYFEMHDPLFSESRSRTEAAGIRELLGLHHGARILDAPCGWGRHAVLLAEAGLDVFGADLSFELLSRAPRAVSGDAAADDAGVPADDVAADDAGGSANDVAADDAGVPADDIAEDRAGESTIPPAYAAADIRALPYADASFDAVINVFTSLGLFLNDDDDIAALREARRVLKPGGALLLESMHRDDVIAQFARRDRWELPDGTEVRVRRRFDAVAGISYERLQWRRGEETGRKQHALRLRTATEIDGLLSAAGFRNVAYFGSWDGEPFEHWHESVIAVARP